MKKSQYIEEILGKPVFEFQKFHSKTKIERMGKNLDPSLWPEEWKTIFYKAYGRFEEFKLPAPNLGKKTLQEALFKRESGREFSKKPLGKKQISNLLYFSAGISVKPEEPAPRRFYPSAGGRYPLEVYLISLNTSLPVGIYHYYVRNNSLEKMFDFRSSDVKKITNLDWVKDAAALIVITAVFKRNTNKYQERGYRHVIAEAGHLAQNLYLVSAASSLSICAIGGYVDDKINELLELDGLDESVVYFLAFGKAD